MGLFTCLVSVDDLAEYMGKPIEELPKNTDILIKRASELINMAIKRNYNPENEAHVEAVKLACCSQCQNWIDNEISPVSERNISSYSLGELSITYSDVDKVSNNLNTMTIRYLNSQYLLYKGMR